MESTRTQTPDHRLRAQTELRELSSCPHGELFDATWGALSRAGLFALATGQEEGGIRAMATILEELGTRGIANVLAVLTAVDGLTIARHGSEELKERFLGPIATGERRFCLAMTEPEAGFNMFAIRTLASRTEEGNYRVNGSKIYISGADLADHMLLFARTLRPQEAAERSLPKTAGLSLFVVPTDAPGITMQPMASRGEGEIRQFAIEFDNVEVPELYRVGKEGAGVLAILDGANVERILVSALLVGIAQHCLDTACSHARERRVFGDTPIGAYQAVQHPLAEVKIRQEGVRLLTERAAGAFDGGASPKEVVYLANSAKFLAAELGAKAVDAAIEALGGRGFDEEAGIIQHLEFVRLARTAPISAPLILNSVAEHVLGLPRSY